MNAAPPIRVNADARPEVVVVTTVYQAEVYLEATVASVRAQTFTDWKLILVNDGSTDDSAALCDRLAEQDERIAVIHRDNGGVSAAANTGIAAALGDDPKTQPFAIARLDADDRMMPDRLTQQVRCLRDRPDVVCVGTDIALIDEADRFLTVEPRPADDAGITDQLLRGHCSISHPSCLIRSAALRAVWTDRGADAAGPYDPVMVAGEDVDLFLRLGEKGALANLSEPLTAYRLHGVSASATHGKAQRENSRQAVDAAVQRRGLTDPPPFEADGLWRPTDQRASRLEFALLYGWWAFQARQFATAAHYGRAALRLSPWNKQAWMLWAKSRGKSNGPAPTDQFNKPTNALNAEAADAEPRKERAA
ncbi:MAG: glycosyltransferase family A protein [Planctomycetota bacterium]